jgi:hypothetical protein
MKFGHHVSPKHLQAVLTRLETVGIDYEVDNTLENGKVTVSVEEGSDHAVLQAINMDLSLGHDIQDYSKTNIVYTHKFKPTRYSNNLHISLTFRGQHGHAMIASMYHNDDKTVSVSGHHTAVAMTHELINLFGSNLTGRFN